MAENTPVTVHRNERVLAFVIGSAIGLSIIAIVAIVVGRVTGAQLGQGVWPTVAVLPLIGLPLGFVLIIALIIVSAIRRAREARDV